jgi:hypothetical protein
MKEKKTNADGALHFLLPYTQHFSSILNRDRIVFYANGEGYPEISGGYAPGDAHLLEEEELRDLVETLGPRFQWVANSTCPAYTADVKEMLHRVAANGASVNVADFKFAHRIKKDFPDIPLTASCIMSLNTNFEKIRASGIFHHIITPQFRNYKFDKLGEFEDKDELIVIVNSTCDHAEDRRRCLRHYDYNSKMYMPPPHENISRDWSEKCEYCRYMTMGGKLLAVQGKDSLSDKLDLHKKYKPEKFPPWETVIQELSLRGFNSFKLQGREFASLKEWAEPISRFVETL